MKNPPQIRKCKLCGAEFPSPPHRESAGGQVYCGKACATEGKKRAHDYAIIQRGRLEAMKAAGYLPSKWSRYHNA